MAGAYPATPATWTIGTNYFTTFVAPSTAVQIYSNSWMYNPYGTSYVAVTKGSGSWSANALASISHLVEGTWKLATPSSASFMTVSIPDKTADLPVDAYRYAYVQVTAEYAASPFVPLPSVAVSGAAQVVGTAFQYTGAYGNNGIYWSNCVSVWRIPASSTVPTNVITLTCTNTSQTVLIDNVIVDTVTVNPSHSNITTIGPAGGVVVTWSSLSDGTIITSETCSIASGSTFPIGTTSVTCTNIDLYSYTTLNSFNVTVNPPPSPQFTQCAANQTNVLGTGCQVTVPDMTSGVVVTGLWVTLSQNPAAGTPVDPGAHTVTITATNNGGSASCEATFMVVGSGPVAVNDPMDTTANSPKTINASKLLSNDSHPDGRAMQVVGVTSSSTNGGTVSFDGTSIVYAPRADYVGADAFTYTNRDCAGLVATAQVVIEVLAGTNFLNLVSVSAATVGPNQVVTIVAQGLPNYSYTLQRAGLLTVSNAAWSNLLTRTASTNAVGYGELIFQDTNPPSPAFYRTKYPPAP